MKPTLVYLHDETPTEAVKIWPEIRDVKAMDVSETRELSEKSGMPVLAVGDWVVISVPEGSPGSLELIREHLYDNYVVAVTVRKSPGAWYGWWAKLYDIALERSVLVTMHDRHELCEALALRAFNIAVRHLDDAADLVRGEGINASPEAMRSEKALSKAIELLKATGFRAPKNK